MGKRNSNIIVLLSSSDDDGDKDGERSLSSSRSYSKPKAMSIVTRANPRAPKKPRVSDSRPRAFKPIRNVDEFEFLDGDFNEVFTGLTVSQSAALMRRGSGELWVDKYRPCTFEELAVHKKKVEEVKAWFEQRFNSSKDKFADHVLVITGPAGVGKSATIHVIASCLGAVVCEWDTPTPTIWKEHIYSSNAGIQYMSKLDEFELFVERIRKYGMISPSFIGDSKSLMMLLIDDLPVAYGKVGCKRLKKCLHLLVQSIRVPTAVVLTDYDQAHSDDGTARFLEELRLFLEHAGACKITFNPITNNSIKRTLSRICSQERCKVTAEQIDSIAKASGGDLRHAITSLQFLAVQDSKVSSSGSIDSCKLDGPMNDLIVNFGRDGTLSLFHALGKFLHNKREKGSTCLLENDRLPLQEKYTRLPLKMDAPEKVLSQTHGQARPVAEFLHENVLDFLSEEAMDDAWTVLSYLSEADLLLGVSHGAWANYNVAEGVQQVAAASVAVRGTLFGNFHPLPPRWHAIRKPKLWQVEKSSLQQKHELAQQGFMVYGGVSTCKFSVIATEYMPAHRWIQHRSCGDLNQMSNQGKEIRDDEMDQMSLDDQGLESSEDEIEDWNMGRSPCFEKARTNKGAWTREEDQRLIAYIQAHGEGCWRSLPEAAGLLRCGKSCRLRWTNYLRPDIKRGNFTHEEDELIIKLHSRLGNKWSSIAARLPGRTDNEIKNYWNTRIKKKLMNQGIDPATHRSINEPETKTLIVLSHWIVKIEERNINNISRIKSNDPDKEERAALNLELRISPPNQHITRSIQK